MRNPKALFLAVIFIIIGFTAHGQISADDASDSQFSHIASTGSPSPTAAALGVYADYPVGNFTGVPPINIPIYEINEGGYKLPISLSYNASGIKVNDIASWVGLGWSLNAGGIITRTVKGVPDDEDSQNIGADGTGIAVGFLFRNYNKSVADINDMYSNINWGTTSSPTPLSDPHSLFNILPFNCGFNTGSSHTSTDLLFLKRRNVDMEPDLYYFNFNGHTGKFVFSQGTDAATNTGVVAPEQHKILQIPQQDIKISYTLDQGYHQNYNEWWPYLNWLQSFTVLDEAGNKYLFDQVESTYSVTHNYFTSNYGINASPYQSAGSDETYKSSWYLSSITTVSGKVIHFNYTTENFGYDLQWTAETKGFNGVSEAPVASSSTTHYVTGLRLSSIVGDDFVVYFDANLSRQDLPGGQALTAIKIFSKDIAGNQTLIKEFDFHCDYLQSPNIPATGINNYMRLMLNSITERGADGMSAKPPYQFFYSGYNSNDNIPPLPNRLSSQQDFWGYFNNNGVDGTDFNNIIPAMYVYPNYSRQDHLSVLQLNSPDPHDPVFTIPGANRNTDVVAVLSGTLNKIQYPTGGSTSFQFEANTFNYEGRNYTGGGLRLAQSTIFDGANTNNNIVKHYTYTQSASTGTSSGVLFNLPNYAFTENFQYGYMPNQYGWQTAEYDPNTIDYYNHNLVVGNVPMNTLSGFDGVNVGYSEITESTDGNGKVLSKYSTPGAYGDMSDGDNLFGAPIVLLIDQANNCLPPTTNTQFSDATGLNTDQWGFPFAPSLNYDWNRGKLLSETSYNQAGTPVSEDDYSYTLYTPNNNGPSYVLGLTDRESANYRLWLSSCTYPQSTLTYLDQISQYKIITSVAKVLSGVTTKLFDGNGNTITNTKSYTYSFNSLLPSVEQDDQSDGTSIITNHTYVNDIDLSGSSTLPDYLGYQNLKSNNINGLVESFVQKKNSDNSMVTIGGTMVTYKPDVPYPAASYVLRMYQPISNFTTASVSPANVAKDNHYEIEKSIDKYDSNGNIIQETSQGILSKAYQWGYNGQYLVAEISNGNSNDFFYESFEEGNGNSNRDDAKRGHYSFYGGYDKTLFNMDNGNYVLSYWQKSATTKVWSFIVNNNVEVTDNWFTIGLSGQIDEVRFYPAGAQMTTMTYDPMKGMTSSTDAKEKTTFYDYDSFQRLMNIRDKDKNIIKSFCYNYAGQPGNCFINLPSFGNTKLDTIFVKSCSTGYIGTQVTYTVPENYYISNLSQRDADNQAKSDAAINGQTYAENYGSCLITDAINLVNSTGDGYQVSFSGHGNATLTYNFTTQGTTTIYVPLGTYDVTIYPTGAYNSHTFEMTGQAMITGKPRTGFDSVNITASSPNNISIY